jgi:CMP-N,N'-diacetyllegionaminic acid synthase
VVRGDRMTPLLPLGPAEQPWHSSQYQSLPAVHVQNASLEIAWTRVVFERRSIAGDVLVPFFTEGYEGFDINDPLDCVVADHLLASGDAVLPPVSVTPYGMAAAGQP